MYLYHRLYLCVASVGIGAHLLREGLLMFELDLYLICLPETRSKDLWFMVIANRRYCLSLSFDLFR